jgi:carbonic anhydrase/acetyltransferase-like protein (isoleucine patch superfamily)
MTIPQYDILHDSSKKKIVVGQTSYNHILARYFNCEIHSIEDCQSRAVSWLEDHQFISASSNITFKKQLATGLQVDWFSVIGTSSTVDPAAVIGRNVFIGHHNNLGDLSFIGDHCSITHFCNFYHSVNLGSFCHVGPHCILTYADFKGECFIGMNTTVFSYPTNPVTVCKNVNLIMDSRVLKNIEKSGTYYHNRLIDTSGPDRKFI